jgi:hypothetical protein
MRRAFLGRAFLACALLICVGLVSAEPGLYSPNCRRGESFSRVLTWRDGSGALVNLTGYTAKLQLRQRLRSGVGDTPVDEFTESAGLTLGGADGTITWAMTPAETTALPVGALAYDLRLTSGTGNVVFLVYGYLNVQEAVTQ